MLEKGFATVPIFFAMNPMPGLEPRVFLWPLLAIGFLAVLFGAFFKQNPNAAPVVEAEDTEEITLSNPKVEPRPLTFFHYDRVVPVAIAAAFYLLGLWRLNYPYKQVFDEVHHVRTAMEFVLGLNPHEWTHPHVAKLAAAAGLYVSGERFDPTDGTWSPDEIFSPHASFAWRLPSLIFGAFALLGQYALTRALFKNRAVATMAMIFLALDGVFFVQSRIAMTNIYTVCFILWGAWGAWLWIERQEARYLVIAGLFLGLALASRWSSLYAYVLIVLFLIINGVVRWRERKFAASFFLQRAALFIPTLIFIPFVIYLLSYVPFVLQGEHGTYAEKLFSWNYNAHGWGKVYTMQGDMYQYHSTLVTEHNYNSPAWSWPLMLRPVWYYFAEAGPDGKKSVYAIWCIGNAFIWWSMIPSLVCSAVLAFFQRRSNLAFIALLGLGQWLCWLAKARGLNFMHYLFEAIPFVCMGLAYLLLTIWQADTKPQVEQAKQAGVTDADMAEEDSGEMWRWYVASYIAAVGFWFVFYYPMLSALGIPGAYSGMHFWLGRIWI